MKADKNLALPGSPPVTTGPRPRRLLLETPGAQGPAVTDRVHSRLGIAGSGIFVALLLSGCSTPAWVSAVKESPPNWLTPYRVDIGQGNYVSESMAAKLQEGLSKEQVRAILGTPLLVDPFRSDRWDYIFDIRRGDGEKERRRFTVMFRDDVLISFGGDPLPKEGGEGVLPSRPVR